MPSRPPIFRQAGYKPAKRVRQPNDLFYLSRPWRELREIVIKRAKGLCERCAANGISRNGRTVNHKNREDGGQIVAPDQLEYLCASCDNKFHSEKGDHMRTMYK